MARALWYTSYVRPLVGRTLIIFYSIIIVLKAFVSFLLDVITYLWIQRRLLVILLVIVGYGYGVSVLVELQRPLSKIVTQGVKGAAWLFSELLELLNELMACGAGMLDIYNIIVNSYRALAFILIEALASIGLFPQSTVDYFYYWNYDVTTTTFGNFSINGDIPQQTYPLTLREFEGTKPLRDRHMRSPSGVMDQWEMVNLDETMARHRFTKEALTVMEDYLKDNEARLMAMPVGKRAHEVQRFEWALRRTTEANIASAQHTRVTIGIPKEICGIFKTIWDIYMAIWRTLLWAINVAFKAVADYIAQQGSVGAAIGNTLKLLWRILLGLVKRIPYSFCIIPPNEQITRLHQAVLSCVCWHRFEGKPLTVPYRDSRSNFYYMPQALLECLTCNSYYDQFNQRADSIYDTILTCPGIRWLVGRAEWARKQIGWLISKVESLSLRAVDRDEYLFPSGRVLKGPEFTLDMRELFVKPHADKHVVTRGMSYASAHDARVVELNAMLAHSRVLRAEPHRTDYAMVKHIGKHGIGESPQHSTEHELDLRQSRKEDYVAGLTPEEMMEENKRYRPTYPFMSAAGFVERMSIMTLRARDYVEVEHPKIVERFRTVVEPFDDNFVRGVYQVLEEQGMHNDTMLGRFLARTQDCDEECDMTLRDAAHLVHGVVAVFGHSADKMRPRLTGPGFNHPEWSEIVRAVQPRFDWHRGLRAVRPASHHLGRIIGKEDVPPPFSEKMISVPLGVSSLVHPMSTPHIVRSLMQDYPEMQEHVMRALLDFDLDGRDEWGEIMTTPEMFAMVGLTMDDVAVANDVLRAEITEMQNNMTTVMGLLNSDLSTRAVVIGGVSVSTIVYVIYYVVSYIWGYVSSALGQLWSALKSALNAAVNFLKEYWDEILRTLAGIVFQLLFLGVISESGQNLIKLYFREIVPALPVDVFWFGIKVFDLTGVGNGIANSAKFTGYEIVNQALYRVLCLFPLALPKLTCPAEPVWEDGKPAQNPFQYVTESALAAPLPCRSFSDCPRGSKLCYAPVDNLNLCPRDSNDPDDCLVPPNNQTIFSYVCGDPPFECTAEITNNNTQTVTIYVLGVCLTWPNIRPNPGFRTPFFIDQLDIDCRLIGYEFQGLLLGTVDKLVVGSFEMPNVFELLWRYITNGYAFLRDGIRLIAASGIMIPWFFLSFGPLLWIMPINTGRIGWYVTYGTLGFNILSYLLFELFGTLLGSCDKNGGVWLFFNLLPRVIPFTWVIPQSWGLYDYGFCDVVYSLGRWENWETRPPRGNVDFINIWCAAINHGPAVAGISTVLLFIRFILVLKTAGIWWFLRTLLLRIILWPVSVLLIFISPLVALIVTIYYRSRLVATVQAKQALGLKTQAAAISGDYYAMRRLRAAAVHTGAFTKVAPREHDELRRVGLSDRERALVNKHLDGLADFLMDEDVLELAATNQLTAADLGVMKDEFAGGVRGLASKFFGGGASAARRSAKPRADPDEAREAVALAEGELDRRMEDVQRAGEPTEVIGAARREVADVVDDFNEALDAKTSPDGSDVDEGFASAGDDDEPAAPASPGRPRRRAPPLAPPPTVGAGMRRRRVVDSPEAGVGVGLPAEDAGAADDFGSEDSLPPLERLPEEDFEDFGAGVGGGVGGGGGAAPSIIGGGAAAGGGGGAGGAGDRLRAKREELKEKARQKKEAKEAKKEAAAQKKAEKKEAKAQKKEQRAQKKARKKEKLKAKKEKAKAKIKADREKNKKDKEGEDGEEKKEDKPEKDEKAAERQRKKQQRRKKQEQKKAAKRKGREEKKKKQAEAKAQKKEKRLKKKQEKAEAKKKKQQKQRESKEAKKEKRLEKKKQQQERKKQRKEARAAKKDKQADQKKEKKEARLEKKKKQAEAKKKKQAEKSKRKQLQKKKQRQRKEKQREQKRKQKEAKKKQQLRKKKQLQKKKKAAKLRKQNRKRQLQRQKQIKRRQKEQAKRRKQLEARKKKQQRQKRTRTREREKEKERRRRERRKKRREKREKRKKKKREKKKKEKREKKKERQKNKRAKERDEAKAKRKMGKKQFKAEKRAAKKDRQRQRQTKAAPAFVQGKRAAARLQRWEARHELMKKTGGRPSMWNALSARFFADVWHNPLRVRLPAWLRSAPNAEAVAFDPRLRPGTRLPDGRVVPAHFVHLDHVGRPQAHEVVAAVHFARLNFAGLRGMLAAALRPGPVDEEAFWRAYADYKKISEVNGLRRRHLHAHGWHLSSASSSSESSSEDGSDSESDLSLSEMSESVPSSSSESGDSSDADLDSDSEFWSDLSSLSFDSEDDDEEWSEDGSSASDTSDSEEDLDAESEDGDLFELSVSFSSASASESSSDSESSDSESSESESSESESSSISEWSSADVEDDDDVEVSGSSEWDEELGPIQRSKNLETGWDDEYLEIHASDDGDSEDGEQMETWGERRHFPPTHYLFSAAGMMDDECHPHQVEQRFKLVQRYDSRSKKFVHSIQRK